MGIVFEGEFKAALGIVTRLDHTEARAVFGCKRRDAAREPGRHAAKLENAQTCSRRLRP